MQRFALPLAVALVASWLNVRAAAQDAWIAKQVSAPASDIRSGRVVLPDPAECATRSSTAQVPVEFTWQPGAGWIFDTTVSVDRAGDVSLVLFSIDAARWTVSVRAPNGAYVPIERAFATGRVDRRVQVLDEEFAGWTVDRYDIASLPSGGLDVRIAVEADHGAQLAPGFLFVRTTSPLALATHVTSLATLSEREIGIVAHIYDSAAGPSSPAIDGIVRTGAIVLETERGSLRIAMQDDGLHDDGAARDGVFGARLPRWMSGDVRARVELRGQTPEGTALVRTAQLAFPVIERRAMWTGDVSTRVLDDLRVSIELGALALGPPAKLHVSAEVWGTNAQGELAPACWLSRMIVPHGERGAWTLPLELDVRWLALAEVHAPFALHAVRVQDPDTEVPIDTVEWLPLVVSELPPAAGRVPVTITPEMTMGRAFVSFQHSAQAGLSSPLTPTVFTRALMLSHGYCSSGPIWPAADFTQPKVEFLDPNANRTHDQFAQLMLQTGSAYGSFGIVAHSQGGAAALHLYTYYASGLDLAAGARKIQSLATPYQGTPLASLGNFSCGVNNDMTPAGAATWLAGIPTWARTEVWYWTTSDAGSACNFFTGLLLTNPEDGVVEMSRGQLPGANSMGNTTGWCHTTGMTYPASYTDHARNALMNAQAAR